MVIVFFYSIFQTFAGFFYVRKVAIFFSAGPFVDYVLFYCDESIFKLHKDIFKGVGSFEDDLHTGILHIFFLH